VFFVAIPFQPVFSQSKRYFFVATTTSVLYSMKTETGDIVWSVSDNFPLSSKPVISHDDKVVYATRENGVVAAFDLGTGEEFWSVTCADLQLVSDTQLSRAATTCVDLIEAESSISPNGLVLFYGDKFGNVKALQLGDSSIPTSPPSEFPTYPVTPSPSESLSAPLVAATSIPIDWNELMSSLDQSLGVSLGKELPLPLASLALATAFAVFVGI
jgi:outer membrane protein assembly factor BamB